MKPRQLRAKPPLADAWTAWQEQLHKQANPELAHTLCKRENELLPLFTCYYYHLQTLPRRWRRSIRGRLRLSLAGVALSLALGQQTALAATINVDGTTCNLVNAINAANTDTAFGGCTAGSGTDTLVLPPNSTTTLTTVNNTTFTPTGLPVVSSAITIEGNGSTIERSSASGIPGFRILAVDDTGDLTLKDATISGAATFSGVGGDGAGVANFGGTVKIINSTIHDNAARYSGGGVANFGEMTIINSSIRDNATVTGRGAGVRNGFNSTPGNMLITNSTISGNDATPYGAGGVINSNNSSLVISNSTITGNSSDSSYSGGGGIYVTGSVTITNSTITGNSSRYGYGGGGVHIGRNGRLSLSRTVISGNDAAGICDEIINYGEQVIANDHNLTGDSSKTNDSAFCLFTPGITDITATSDGTTPTALNAILNTTLANNGGPTETHALVAGSPAIDASPDDAGCPSTDQRGIPRPQGTSCDIGAYEAEKLLPAAQPHVQCPGDVNDDGVADIAVVTPDRKVRVKGLNGGMVSQFALSDITAVVDVEVMPDINTNGSPELVALGTGSVKAEVWDTLTSAQLSLVNFDPALMPLDLELVDDQTSNSIPELANLALGSVKVEVKDGLNSDPVNSVSFTNNYTPMDLEIYPDSNSNGSPELAVLGDNKDPAKGDKVEVRDLKTGNIVQNIWLGKGWQVLQQELLTDRNGNGAQEVAVLRVKNNDDAVNVMLRDTKTRQRLGSIGFDRNYPPTQLLTIADVNGNGADEVVVFGQRVNGGNQKAQVKDSKTKALIRAVFFDKNFVGQDIATCADINGNGAEELVLLGERASDGKLKAIVKDAKTGERIGVVNF